MNESQQILAKSVSERELSDWVVGMAHLLGWRVARWPTFRPTATDPGVPDLLLARDGVLLAVELKTDAGRLSEHQEGWRTASGEHYRLWRVSDWFSGEIEKVLTHREQRFEQHPHGAIKHTHFTIGEHDHR